MGRPKNGERFIPKTAFRLLNATSDKVEKPGSSCFHWQVDLWRKFPRTELPGVAVVLKWLLNRRFQGVRWLGVIQEHALVDLAGEIYTIFQQFDEK